MSRPEVNVPNFGSGVVIPESVRLTKFDEGIGNGHKLHPKSVISWAGGKSLSNRLRVATCIETLVPVEELGCENYWPGSFVDFSGEVPAKEKSYIISGEKVYEAEGGYFFWRMVEQNDVGSIVTVAEEEERKNYEVSEGQCRDFGYKGRKIRVACTAVKVDSLGVILCSYWQNNFTIRKYTITDPADAAKPPKIVYHFFSNDYEKGKDPVSINTESLVKGMGAGYEKSIEECVYKIQRAQHLTLSFVKHVRDCQEKLEILERVDQKAYIHCVSGMDRTGAYIVFDYLLSQAKRFVGELTAEEIKKSLNVVKIAKFIEASTVSGGAVAMLQEKLTTIVTDKELSVLLKEPFLTEFSIVLCNVAKGNDVDYGAPGVGVAAAVSVLENVKLRFEGHENIEIKRDAGDEDSQLYSKMYLKLIELGLITADTELGSITDASAGSPSWDFSKFNERTPGLLAFVPRVSYLENGIFKVTFNNEAKAQEFCNKTGQAIKKENGWHNIYIKYSLIELKKEEAKTFISGALKEIFPPLQVVRSASSYADQDPGQTDVGVVAAATGAASWGSRGAGEVVVGVATEEPVTYHTLSPSLAVKPEAGVGLVIQARRSDEDEYKARVSMGFQVGTHFQVGFEKRVLKDAQENIAKATGEKLISIFQGQHDSKIGLPEDLFSKIKAAMQVDKSKFYEAVLKPTVKMAHEIAIINDGLTSSAEKKEAARSCFASSLAGKGLCNFNAEEIFKLASLFSAKFQEQAEELKIYSGRIQSARQDKITGFRFKRSELDPVLTGLDRAFTGERRR